MLIFPAIDLYEGKAVRLYQGDYAQMTVYSDDLPALAADFAAPADSPRPELILDLYCGTGTIGLSMASRAAARMGDMPEDEAKRVINALISLGLPTVCPYPAEAVARAALSDKKRADDKISVIVPEGIGACRIENIPIGRLIDYVRAGIEAL